MSQPRGNGRKRAWVLANVVGGVALIVVLSLVLIGSPGSGQADANGSGADAVGSSGPGSCTLFQQMVDQCPNATTTTTTSSPPSAGSAASGGGSTTYSSTENGAPGASGPHASAPAAPATPPATAAPAAPAGSGPCAGTAPPVTAPSGSWHCTLDDEFNGTSLDGSKWSPMLTYASAYRTGPLFHQVCYVNNPDTINVSGGTLNLSVVQSAQPIGCQGTYASKGQTDIEGGMVISYNLFSQEYGFFEASAEMPATSVPGLQETLWLYPQNETLYGPWPDSGEIDYGEFYSEYPNNDVPAIHYPGVEQRPQFLGRQLRARGVEPGGPVPHLCGALDADLDHHVLRRPTLHDRRVRALREQPRHGTRAVQPTVLLGAHRGARSRERRSVPARCDTASGHHEDRLGPVLAVRSRNVRGQDGTQWVVDDASHSTSDDVTSDRWAPTPTGARRRIAVGPLRRCSLLSGSDVSPHRVAVGSMPKSSAALSPNRPAFT